MVTFTDTEHDIVIGSPFYALDPGNRPALHKFDRADFVPRYIDEVTAAAQGRVPPSFQAAVDAAATGFDPDTLDFPKQTSPLPHVHKRYRKLFLPTHFRFYLSACELRCRVPGGPAPSRGRVKKVEMVVRRKGLVNENPGSPLTDEEKAEEQKRVWAWVKVPEPELFRNPPPNILQMSSRLTGNTHTWWPLPADQDFLEGEQRYKMSRVFSPGLPDRAVYFVFLPVASGEMYGPRNLAGGVHGQSPGVPPPTPPPPPPPPYDATMWPSLQPTEYRAANPLVPAPRNFALTVKSALQWSRDWFSTLGIFDGKNANSLRPKFEPPPGDANPRGGWGYYVQCVATVEVHPGCTIEIWGPPSELMVVAQVFDPFAGRPTKIAVPSLGDVRDMLNGLSDARIQQIVVDNGVGIQNDGDVVQGNEDPKNSTVVKAAEICFTGLPLIMICASLMFSIGLAILILVLGVSFAILLRLKFCIPIKK